MHRSSARWHRRAGSYLVSSLHREARWLEFQMENLQRDGHHRLIPPIAPIDTGETGPQGGPLLALDDRMAPLAILLVATGVAPGTLWSASPQIDRCPPSA